MTYTVSGANFNKDVATQGTSINYKENKTAKSEGVAGAFAGVVISGGVTAATDNTYEGLLKEADDVKSQIMASASDVKLSLKALMMKLSGADAVKLDEDGFNLTDATPHDMVNIVENGRPYWFNISINGSGSNSSILNTPSLSQTLSTTNAAPIIAGTPVV